MRSHRHYSERPSRHSVNHVCQVVRERDFLLVADRIENLSTWGMLVSPSDPVVTGERVIVSFQLPGSEAWFDACGTVTRVLHGRRPGEITRKLGIEFEFLGPYDRFRLRRALAGRPPAPPGVRPGRRDSEFDLTAIAA